MEFRENIPTITGPGAFFIALVITALLITSQVTRDFLLEKWSVTIGLVAISIPLSVLFNQIYHSLFLIFGFKKKHFHKKFRIKNDFNYLIDTMLDYSSFESKESQKEWFIIQKRATAFNFNCTILMVTIIFTIIYILYLILGCSIKYIIGKYCIIGNIAIIVLCILLIILFMKTCKKLWSTLMVLDRKLLEKQYTYIKKWLIEEGIIQDNDEKN